MKPQLQWRQLASEREVLCVVILYCRNHRLHKLEKYQQISVAALSSNNRKQIPAALGKICKATVS